MHAAKIGTKITRSKNAQLTKITRSKNAQLTKITRSKNAQLMHTAKIGTNTLG